MAIVLQFDAVDDYVSIPSYVVAENADFDFTSIVNYSSGTRTLLGNASSGQGYLRLSSPTMFRFHTVIGGNTNISCSMPQNVDGTIVRMRRVSNTFELFINGSSQGTGTNSGALDLTAIGQKGNSGFFSNSMASVALDSARFYDANASVHTAGTPILKDTIGGQDGTGVNMPTAALGQPGSAWLDLGGSGTSASIVSTMPSMTSTGVFTQEAPVAVLNASIASIMPSMVSAASFTQTVPEFNNSIVSNMPSMESSANFTRLEPGFNASIITTMPSMLSSAAFTQTVPSFDTSINSDMPGMTSAATFAQSSVSGVGIVSTMPSMISAAVFGHTVPEFDTSIISTMPSMVSSASIQNLVPGNNSAISSAMPSMVSSATFTIEDPAILDAAIISTMPSMVSSSTFFNGILSIVIGEGNNIDIVIKSRNINIQTKSRNI